MTRFALFLVATAASLQLIAQPSTEQRLGSGLYRIVLTGGEKEVLLADRVEFDPADRSLYLIDRKEGVIRHRPQAWRLSKDGKEEMLAFSLWERKEVVVQLSSATDSTMAGTVARNSGGYATLTELAGAAEGRDLGIRFEKDRLPVVSDIPRRIAGLWRYENESDEFEMAGTEMSKGYTLRFKADGEVEHCDQEGGSVVRRYGLRKSPQGRYLRLYDQVFKEESVHFVYWVGGDNLFLTSALQGEVKNMQLRRVHDLLKEGVGFTFYHAKGAPIPVVSHRSYNMIQEVEKGEDGYVHVRRRNILLPERIEGAYPLVYTQPPMPDAYLKPGRYVNADDPEVKAFTAAIMKGKNFTNQHELVMYVIRQCAARMKYGDSELIPSASEALTKGVGNCIGYTHLPAAVLRNLGIPTRNVRAFITNPVRKTGISFEVGQSAGNFSSQGEPRPPWVPHYLLEVFYPSLNQWVSFDPQSRLEGISFFCVALYEAPDWDMAKHRATRPMALDPNLVILGGNAPRPKGAVPEIPQVERIEPDRVTIAPGVMFSVYTRQSLEDIASVDYINDNTRAARMIKDDHDERKWNFHQSTLDRLGYPPENIKVGRKWDFAGDGFLVTDRYGTLTLYQRMENTEFAEPRYIFDILYYKTLLGNVKLVDTRDGYMEYAFCGDEIIRFERNKGAAAPTLRAPCQFRLNARRGPHIDVLTKAGQPEPFSLRLNVSEDGQSVRIGEKEYRILRESYCH